MSAETDQSCPFQSANERPEPISAEIKGIIPTWLTGTLIRIGPGRFECCETPLKHWLDGQGLLLHFHIEAGHVTYSNKFVRSDSYADTLDPDPCRNIFSRFFSRFRGKDLPFDNTNVNVFMMKDKMFATSESNFLYEIDAKTP